MLSRAERIVRVCHDQRDACALHRMTLATPGQRRENVEPKNLGRYITNGCLPTNTRGRRVTDRSHASTRSTTYENYRRKVRRSYADLPK